MKEKEWVNKSKQNLCDYVVDNIKNSILSGKYKSGDRLPNEFELAKEYNVSRFTIREAVKKLIQLDLIEVVRGKGTFVKVVSPESFMNPLLSMLILDDSDIEHILEVREPLEQTSVRLCTRRATKEEKQILKEHVKKLDKNLKEKDYNEYNENDLVFHLLLSKFSGNKILYKIMQVIKDLLYSQMVKEGLDKAQMGSSENAYKNSNKAHKEIIAAIIEGDEEQAVSLLNEHMED